MGFDTDLQKEQTKLASLHYHNGEKCANFALDSGQHASVSV